MRWVAKVKSGASNKAQFIQQPHSSQDLYGITFPIKSLRMFQGSSLPAVSVVRQKEMARAIGAISEAKCNSALAPEASM